MILECLAFGLLVGLAMGALGGGGSILTVPALVFALGLTAQEATTGSLVIVGITAGTAAVGHARAGRTRWGAGLALAAVGVPAALLGTRLNHAVDPDVLLLCFAGLMLVAAAGMVRQSLTRTPSTPPRGAPAAPLPASASASAPATSGSVAVLEPSLAEPDTQVSLPALVAAGLGIGLLTGFLGVGGGFVIVPVLVVLLAVPMPVAVGTSLLVISLNSGVALLARAGEGGFVWSVIVPFTLAAVVGSLGGKRVADRVPTAALTRGFAGLLVTVALYVAAQALL